MAGHARYTALLDACVLYPIAVCDSLLSVAWQGLYAAKWSLFIEKEWMRALERNQNKPLGTFDRRRDFMRAAVPDWEVAEEAWQSIKKGLWLPDMNDVHVLAAAIAGHADCIVTANLADFPDSVLSIFGLMAIHPDDFLVAQMDLDQVRVLAAFKDQRARLKRHEYTPEYFADKLERNGLVQTAQRLRLALELI
jgi:hypothetical protein